MIELQSGNLNEVSLIEGTGSRLSVLRKPQPIANIQRTMNQVIDECLIEGFLNNPSSQIGIRSLAEQATFAQRLRQNGIPTPAISLNTSGEQLMDYVPNTDKLYNLWLNQDPRASYATSKILQAVMKAHEVDLVLGDRTGKNDLVTPEADIVLIDFDIKLSGSEAREFEFTNLMYRLSRAAHRGNPKQLPLLGNVYKGILSNPQIGCLYDQTTLLQYFIQFAKLSSDEGEAKLTNMTPIVNPEYNAELFIFLVDVLKINIRI